MKNGERKKIWGPPPKKKREGGIFVFFFFSLGVKRGGSRDLACTDMGARTPLGVRQYFKSIYFDNKYIT